jgi:hypothetical protein
MPQNGIADLKHQRIGLSCAPGERRDTVTPREEIDLRTLIPDIAIATQATVGGDPKLIGAPNFPNPFNADRHLRLPTNSGEIKLYASGLATFDIRPPSAPRLQCSL